MSYRRQEASGSRQINPGYGTPTAQIAISFPGVAGSRCRNRGSCGYTGAPITQRGLYVNDVNPGRRQPSTHTPGLPTAQLSLSLPNGSIAGGSVHRPTPPPPPPIVQHSSTAIRTSATSSDHEVSWRPQVSVISTKPSGAPGFQSNAATTPAGSLFPQAAALGVEEAASSSWATQSMAQRSVGGSGIPNQEPVSLCKGSSSQPLYCLCGGCQAAGGCGAGQQNRMQWLQPTQAVPQTLPQQIPPTKLSLGPRDGHSVNFDPRPTPYPATPDIIVDHPQQIPPTKQSLGSQDGHSVNFDQRPTPYPSTLDSIVERGVPASIPGDGKLSLSSQTPPSSFSHQTQKLPPHNVCPSNYPSPSCTTMHQPVYQPHPSGACKVQTVGECSKNVPCPNQQRPGTIPGTIPEVTEEELDSDARDASRFVAPAGAVEIGAPAPVQHQQPSFSPPPQETAPGPSFVKHELPSTQDLPHQMSNLDDFPIGDIHPKYGKRISCFTEQRGVNVCDPNQSKISSFASQGGGGAGGMVTFCAGRNATCLGAGKEEDEERKSIPQAVDKYSSGSNAKSSLGPNMPLPISNVVKPVEYDQSRMTSDSVTQPERLWEISPSIDRENRSIIPDSMKLGLGSDTVIVKVDPDSPDQRKSGLYLPPSMDTNNTTVIPDSFSLGLKPSSSKPGDAPQPPVRKKSSKSVGIDTSTKVSSSIPSCQKVRNGNEGAGAVARSFGSLCSVPECPAGDSAWEVSPTPAFGECLEKKCFSDKGYGCHFVKNEQGQKGTEDTDDRLSSSSSKSEAPRSPEKVDGVSLDEFNRQKELKETIESGHRRIMDNARAGISAAAEASKMGLDRLRDVKISIEKIMSNSSAPGNGNALPTGSDRQPCEMPPLCKTKRFCVGKRHANLPCDDETEAKRPRAGGSGAGSKVSMGTSMEPQQGFSVQGRPSSEYLGSETKERGSDAVSGSKLRPQTRHVSTLTSKSIEDTKKRPSISSKGDSYKTNKKSTCILNPSKRFSSCNHSTCKEHVMGCFYKTSKFCKYHPTQDQNGEGTDEDKQGNGSELGASKNKKFCDSYLMRRRLQPCPGFHTSRKKHSEKVIASRISGCQRTSGKRSRQSKDEQLGQTSTQDQEPTPKDKGRSNIPIVPVYQSYSVEPTIANILRHNATKDQGSFQQRVKHLTAVGCLKNPLVPSETFVNEQVYFNKTVKKRGNNLQHPYLSRDISSLPSNISQCAPLLPDAQEPNLRENRAFSLRKKMARRLRDAHKRTTRKVKLTKVNDVSTHKEVKHVFTATEVFSTATSKDSDQDSPPERTQASQTLQQRSISTTTSGQSVLPSLPSSTQSPWVAIPFICPGMVSPVSGTSCVFPDAIATAPGRDFPIVSSLIREIARCCCTDGNSERGRGYHGTSSLHFPEGNASMTYHKSCTDHEKYQVVKKREKSIKSSEKHSFNESPKGSAQFGAQTQKGPRYESVSHSHCEVDIKNTVYSDGECTPENKKNRILQDKAILPLISTVSATELKYAPADATDTSSQSAVNCQRKKSPIPRYGHKCSDKVKRKINERDICLSTSSEMKDHIVRDQKGNGGSRTVKHRKTRLSVSTKKTSNSFVSKMQSTKSSPSPKKQAEKEPGKSENKNSKKLSASLGYSKTNSSLIRELLFESPVLLCSSNLKENNTQKLTRKKNGDDDSSSGCIRTTCSWYKLNANDLNLPVKRSKSQKEPLHSPEKGPIAEKESSKTLEVQKSRAEHTAGQSCEEDDICSDCTSGNDVDSESQGEKWKEASVTSEDNLQSGKGVVQENMSSVALKKSASRHEKIPSVPPKVSSVIPLSPPDGSLLSPVHKSSDESRNKGNTGDDSLSRERELPATPPTTRDGDFTPSDVKRNGTESTLSSSGIKSSFERDIPSPLKPPTNTSKSSRDVLSKKECTHKKCFCYDSKASLSKSSKRIPAKVSTGVRELDKTNPLPGSNYKSGIPSTKLVSSNARENIEHTLASLNAAHKTRAQTTASKADHKDSNNKISNTLTTLNAVHHFKKKTLSNIVHLSSGESNFPSSLLYAVKEKGKETSVKLSDTSRIIESTSTQTPLLLTICEEKGANEDKGEKLSLNVATNTTVAASDLLTLSHIRTTDHKTTISLKAGSSILVKLDESLWDGKSQKNTEKGTDVVDDNTEIMETSIKTTCMPRKQCLPPPPPQVLPHTKLPQQDNSITKYSNSTQVVSLEPSKSAKATAEFGKTCKLDLKSRIKVKRDPKDQIATQLRNSLKNFALLREQLLQRRPTSKRSFPHERFKRTNPSENLNQLDHQYSVRSKTESPKYRLSQYSQTPCVPREELTKNVNLEKRSKNQTEKHSDEENRLTLVRFDCPDGKEKRGLESKHSSYLGVYDSKGCLVPEYPIPLDLSSIIPAPSVEATENSQHRTFRKYSPGKQSPNRHPSHHGHRSRSYSDTRKSSSERSGPPRSRSQSRSPSGGGVTERSRRKIRKTQLNRHFPSTNQISDGYRISRESKTCSEHYSISLHHHSGDNYPNSTRSLQSPQSTGCLKRKSPSRSRSREHPKSSSMKGRVRIQEEPTASTHARRFKSPRSQGIRADGNELSGPSANSRSPQKRPMNKPFLTLSCPFTALSDNASDDSKNSMMYSLQYSSRLVDKTTPHVATRELSELETGYIADDSDDVVLEERALMRIGAGAWVGNFGRDGRRTGHQEASEESPPRRGIEAALWRGMGYCLKDEKVEHRYYLQRDESVRVQALRRPTKSPVTPVEPSRSWASFGIESRLAPPPAHRRAAGEPPALMQTYQRHGASHVWRQRPGDCT